MSKRPDLISATCELLWERGYESTSPNDVLDRSGAGKGSLYHHFDGKKALAEEALKEIESKLIASLDATLRDGERSPLDRIRAWLDETREPLKGCRLGGLSSERSVIEDEELRRPVARYFEVVLEELESALEAAVDAGEIPSSIDTGQLSAMLLSVVQGGFVSSRALQDPQQMTKATQAAKSLLANVTPNS